MSTTESPACKPLSLTTLKRIIARWRRIAGPIELADLFRLLLAATRQVADDLVVTTLEQVALRLPAPLDADEAATRSCGGR